MLDVDAFLVLKHGKIVHEEYFHGMKPETPHAILSVIKSVEATVIATLLEEGLLDANCTIEKYVKELVGTGYEGATIRLQLSWCGRPRKLPESDFPPCSARGFGHESGRSSMPMQLATSSATGRSNWHLRSATWPAGDKCV